MESANFHHHQEEDHEVVYAFPFPTPSCYGLPWSQNPILMSRNNSSNTMVQDLGFPIESFMTHELQHLGRTTDEFLASGSYPKFLELLNYCSPTSSIEDLHFHPYSSNMKNDHRQQLIYSNTNQDFLLSNFWNDQCQMKGGQYIQNCSDETFSQIFPTINISSLNQSSPSASSSSSSSSSAISSSSFDMNCLPASDIFVSPNFDGSFGHPSSLNPHNLLNMHQPTSHRPSVCPSKMPSVSTTASTYESSKRPATKFIDAKSTQSVVPKKSKMEPRPSSAPFQVRKEKLGDRIAAIQQLVAPFGKTDTASVLMEAIGYIKFLQTQLETLSVPYMKSTDKNGGISSQGGQIEAKRDLRSRGLCLVPLSYLSYVTDGGEAICRPVP